MACIEHGLPMIAIPLAGDQFANAARCADLGAASVVAPNNRIPEAIRTATMEVLENSSYREGAMRLRQEFEALPSIEYGVTLLETLAFTKEPVCRK